MDMNMVQMRRIGRDGRSHAANAALAPGHPRFLPSRLQPGERRPQNSHLTPPSLAKSPFDSSISQTHPAPLPARGCSPVRRRPCSKFSKMEELFEVVSFLRGASTPPHHSLDTICAFISHRSWIQRRTRRSDASVERSFTGRGCSTRLYVKLGGTLRDSLNGKIRLYNIR